MSNAVSFYLREETWSLHEQLDRMPLLARLGSGEASVVEVCLVLMAWLPLWVQWESRVCSNQEILRIFSGLGSWQRSELLKSDLVALGVDRGEVESVATVALAALGSQPEHCANGSAVGLLYVLEGSRLGGVAIARRLGSKIMASLDGRSSGVSEGCSGERDSLAGSGSSLTPTVCGPTSGPRGLAFFHGFGEGTPRHWRRFKEALDGCRWSSNDLVLMVGSARECFEALIRCTGEVQVCLDLKQAR